MSFTIKCDECGQEQVFKPNDSYHGDKIDIDIDVHYGYSGGWIRSVDIYCENPKCNHEVSM